jgi:DNA-binding NarL/FixJ family response regulator
MVLNRALIVEDDNKFRALLKRMLEKKFHMIVLEADNGLKGLEVYKREFPNLDVIFLDISMPFMNGIELLDRIRKEDKDTPVIVMTCMGDKESVQSMISLGVTEYILKTEFITHLSDRIETILHKALKP